MNKNVLSQLIGIGLFLVVLASLVGCSLGEVERAAASNITTSAENSDSGIDPADRKFFDVGYMADYGASESLTHLSNIDPADRKFYTNEYAIGSREARLVNPLANVDPAELKFFTNGGYGSDTP